MADEIKKDENKEINKDEKILYIRNISNKLPDILESLSKTEKEYNSEDDINKIYDILKNIENKYISKKEDPDGYFILNTLNQEPYVVPYTLMTIMYSALLLHKNFRFIMSNSAHLPKARLEGIKTIRDMYNIKPNTRVLFVDSDLLLQNSPEEFSQIIKEADEKNINICGLYRKGNGEYAMQKTNGKSITDEDLNKPEYIDGNYVELYNREPKIYPLFGFTYTTLPREDYDWKWNGYAGEDMFLYLQNEDMWKNTKLDKRIKLLHYKSNWV